jgi:uncharacterized protein YecE (DUF72 family)
VKLAAQGTRLLFVLFNNHWQGYAPRNAADAMKKLELPMKKPLQEELEEDETGYR